MLYWYEYLLTLDQEISHIWAKKWALSIWIFVINRYTALFSVTFALLPATSYKVRIADTALVFTTYNHMFLLVEVRFVMVPRYAIYCALINNLMSAVLG